MGRIAIFFFFDNDGVVRDFVTYYLKGLHDVAQKVYVVANGKINDEGKEKLTAVSDEMLIRENKGFDVWAYRDAINHIGWEAVRACDELILCNFTCYGPIYPFNEMFNKMEKQDCDFWGAVKHPEQPDYLLPDKGGYIYEHIMSYFTVIRKRMLKSEAFQEYWENIPEINSKTESTALHETVFTRHFEKLGFRSDSYVDLQKYKGRCNNSSIFLADELLIQDRCPLLKRRAFAFPLYDNLLNESAGSNATGLMQYIRENTNYDVNMIWQDLLETQPMSVIRNNMHLSYIIPEMPASEHKSNDTTVFLIYLENTNQLAAVRRSLSRIGGRKKAVFLYENEEIERDSAFYKNDPDLLWKKIDSAEYGSEVACLLACVDAIGSFKYCCCVFSYYQIESRLCQSFEDYCKHVYDSLFYNNEYVVSILSCFSKDSRLGCLTPYKTEFASYFVHPIQYVLDHRDKLQNAHEQLGLRVPFDGNIYFDPAFAFWVRSDVLMRFVRILQKDPGCIRLFHKNVASSLIPAIAQECGYYTASVIPLNNAVRLLDNYGFMQNYLIGHLITSGFKGKSFREAVWHSMQRSDIAKLNMNQGDVDINRILSQKIALRDLIRLLLRYPRNKLDNIIQSAKKWVPKNRSARQNLMYGAHLANAIVENGCLVFFFMVQNHPGDTYLEVGGKIFSAKKDLSDGQKSIVRFMSEYSGYMRGNALFFEVPLPALKNQRVALLNSDGVQINFCWRNHFSFNALELRKYGLYVRVKAGAMWIQTKAKYVLRLLLSRYYPLSSKALFLFALVNPYHPYTLFAENGNMADNSAQLFQYALQKGEKVYFVTSQTTKDSEQDPALERRMVVHNSTRHIWITLLSKRWIGSYSFPEILPTRCLEDVHLSMLPLEWDFIPHGMVVNGKEVAMLQHYNWNNPSRTFANTAMEAQAYANIYGFKNTLCLGSPRMDKWANAKLNEKEILIFFTWRMALSYIVQKLSNKELQKTDYFKLILEAVTEIRKAYPEKEIYYVFHHEVIRNKCDKLIQTELEPYRINFIRLNTAQGTKEFNDHFSTAKYLVTDVSSVAWDFSYKENGIVIHYLPDRFISGHYKLTPPFYEQQLGSVAKTVNELIQALKDSCLDPKIQQKRDEYFLYHDSCNSERVFYAIFQTPAPDSFLS